MSETRIDRRQVVRVAAGVAAGGALAVGTGVGTASAHGDDNGHGLLGAWWVTHTDDPPGTETGVAVVGFAAGGVLISNEVQPAGPIGNGAWSMDGDRFRGTFWYATPGPTPADPGFTIKISVRGRLDDGKIKGTFSATDGTDTFTGTFTGTRINP